MKTISNSITHTQSLLIFGYYIHLSKIRIWQITTSGLFLYDPTHKNDLYIFNGLLVNKDHATEIIPVIAKLKIFSIRSCIEKRFSNSCFKMIPDQVFFFLNKIRTILKITF